MRSSHLQYLGYVLIGIGSGLLISGLIAFIYFQQRPWIISQYRGIALPLVIVGICLIILGIVAFYRAREKGRHELEGEIPPLYLPPPPPLPSPPPPP